MLVTTAVRTLSLLLFCGFFSLAANAQDTEKTWIFFTDKLDAAGKTTTVEPGYVSPRAKDRRSLRGSITDPTLDAPLSSMYLDALAAEGVKVIRTSRWLNAVSAYLSADQHTTVGQLPFVRKLQPVANLTHDAVLSAPQPLVFTQPTSRKLDCGYSCTQLMVVNAVTPLDNGIDGTGIMVGFVDTRFEYDGVPLGHESTKHLADDNRVIHRDFTADDPGVTDRQDDFHGVNTTSVTFGYDVGELIGPCHNADSVFLAETEWAPLERNVEEDNFVEAVEWMESRGVDVINSSLGYNIFDDGENSYSTSDMDGDTGLTTIAYDLAAQNGVVPVSSAGNSGGTSWNIITTPADGDSVISVGAVYDDKILAGFSSRGPTADGRTKPEVMAQGADVYVGSSNGDDSGVDGDYFWADGTSFSAPMVTGVVCQILQTNPQLTPFEVREILMSTADNAQDPNNNYGWGVVDAQAAITRADDLSTGVADEHLDRQPSLFTVHPPFPNPFGEEETSFVISLSEPLAHVEVEVFNVIGQRILTPHAGPLGAGEHSIGISGEGLPPGLYTFVVSGGGTSHTGVMVHVR